MGKPKPRLISQGENAFIAGYRAPQPSGINATRIGTAISQRQLLN
jgi:hypothetical protein